MAEEKISDEVTGRKWWPADYADEMMPVPLASPEDWIRPLGDGFFTVKSPYHDDPEDEAARWQFHPLKDGEKIEFCFRDDFPDLEITINRDGTFVLKGETDPRANMFMAYGCIDSGMMGTVKEFVDAYIEMDILDGDEETITLCQCYWSTDQDSTTYSVKLEPGKATLELAGRA